MSVQYETFAARWFEEVWNARSDAIIDEVVGPETIGHMEGAEVLGPEPFKAAGAALLAAFPDFRVTVEATAVDGDNIVSRWTAQGTHKGPAFGLAATGSSVRFRGTTWFCMKQGRIAEAWDSWNLGALIESLKA